MKQLRLFAFLLAFGFLAAGIWIRSKAEPEAAGWDRPVALAAERTASAEEPESSVGRDDDDVRRSQPDAAVHQVERELRGTVSIGGIDEFAPVLSGSLTLRGPDGARHRAPVVEGSWRLDGVRLGEYQVTDVELEGRAFHPAEGSFDWRGEPVHLVVERDGLIVIAAFAEGAFEDPLPGVEVGLGPSFDRVGKSLFARAQQLPLTAARSLGSGSSPLLVDVPQRPRAIWVRADGFAWKRTVVAENQIRLSVELQPSGGLRVQPLEFGELPTKAVLRLYEKAVGVDWADLPLRYEVVDLPKGQSSLSVPGLLPGRYMARLEIDSSAGGVRQFDPQDVVIEAGEVASLGLIGTESESWASACNLSLQLSGPADLFDAKGLELELHRLSGTDSRKRIFRTFVRPDSIAGSVASVFVEFPALRSSTIEVSIPAARFSERYDIAPGEARVETVQLEPLATLRVGFTRGDGGAALVPAGSRVSARSMDKPIQVPMGRFDETLGYAELSVPPGSYTLYGVTKGFHAGPHLVNVEPGMNECSIVLVPRVECAIIVKAVDSDGLPVALPASAWDTLQAVATPVGEPVQRIFKGSAPGVPMTLQMESSACQNIYDQAGVYRFSVRPIAEQASILFEVELAGDKAYEHTIVVR